MRSISRIIIILISIIILSNCTYWPRAWSENGIRKLIREEIEYENNNR